MIHAFVDTNVLKHTIEKRPLAQFPVTDEHGKQVLRAFYSGYVPRPRHLTPALTREIESMRALAKLAIDGVLGFLCSVEVQLEFWQLPETWATGPLLFGAPIKWAKPPLRYSRVAIDPLQRGSRPTQEAQLAFLRRIKHRRFMELALACGVPPDMASNENQLIDAFHIWWAESAGASHFLTCDFKLIRQLRQYRTHRPQLAVVAPSTLASEQGVAFYDGPAVK
jgi:hypothetical protein